MKCHTRSPCFTGAWVYAVLFFRGYVWSAKLKRGLSAYLPPPGAQPTWEVVTKDIGGIKVPATHCKRIFSRHVVEWQSVPEPRSSRSWF